MVGLVCVKYHPRRETGGVHSRIKDISLEQFALLPLALVPSVSRKENFSRSPHPLLPDIGFFDCI